MHNTTTEECAPVSFCWVITDFNGRHEQILNSPIFAVGFHKFRVNLYPFGHGGHKGFVSIYLEAIRNDKEDPNSWKRPPLKYKITLYTLGKKEVLESHELEAAF